MAESPASPYGTQPCATKRLRQASAVAATVASVLYIAVESPTYTGVRRNRQLAGFHVTLILQPDVQTAVPIGRDRDKNDESATREHPASRLVSDRTVRQFFLALPDERLPIELEGRLNIARCEVEKERHLGRLERLRTVHERKRREIQDPGCLFHCGRRFDRVGRSRVVRRLVFRSTSEKATKYACRKNFFHHGPTAEVRNLVHTPR